MPKEFKSYPDRIGLLIFKDGYYEVDFRTPDIAPNVVYVREDTIELDTRTEELITVLEEIADYNKYLDDGCALCRKDKDKHESACPVGIAQDALLKFKI